IPRSKVRILHGPLPSKVRPLRGHDDFRRIGVTRRLCVPRPHGSGAATNRGALRLTKRCSRAFTSAWARLDRGRRCSRRTQVKGVVMKSSFIMLATAAAVVASVSAASATSRPASVLAAKQGCAFVTLPRATPAGQQSLYGHISSFTRKGNHYVLRF